MADWTGTGEAYATSFARLCEGAAEPLLDALAVSRGQEGGSFLDVGCGSGTVAGAAARRGYLVQGVDAETSMVETARRRNPRIDFSRAVLPDLPFADVGFDAVAASFVLNHVDDPAGGVAELARVTAPHGAVAVTVWPSGVSPLRPMWHATLERSRVGAYPTDTMALEPAIERSSEGLAGLLAGAGLTEVRGSTPSWVFAIAPDELWHGVEGGVAMIGGIHRSLDAEGRRAMRRAYEVEASQRVGADGMLRFPHTAILAVGVRPA